MQASVQVQADSPATKVATDVSHFAFQIFIFRSNLFSSIDTGRDGVLGGVGGAELAHHHHGTASGTHGNRDGILGAGAGAAAGHHGSGGRTF